MYEYVYVWDRVNDRCVAVWHVRMAGLDNGDGPVNVKGSVEETSIDKHIKKLLVKYPEPRYLVDGGESPEPDGAKAASELYERTKLDEEE